MIMFLNFTISEAILMPHKISRLSFGRNCKVWVEKNRLQFEDGLQFP
jgi:hypothetical protein